MVKVHHDRFPTLRFLHCFHCRHRLRNRLRRILRRPRCIDLNQQDNMDEDLKFKSFPILAILSYRRQKLNSVCKQSSCKRNFSVSFYFHWIYKALLTLLEFLSNGLTMPLKGDIKWYIVTHIQSGLSLTLKLFCTFMFQVGESLCHSLLWNN